MKVFKTNNRDTVSCCRMQFHFELPRALAQKRSKDFVVEYRTYYLLMRITCAAFVILVFFVFRLFLFFISIIYDDK